MRLANLIRSTVVVDPDERGAQQITDELRAARIETARRAGWRQVEHTSLVKRGRWLVDAETDELLVPRGGTTFEPGRAELISGQGLDLLYAIDEDGDVLVLEKVGNPQTWSEVVRRQALRGASA